MHGNDSHTLCAFYIMSCGEEARIHKRLLREIVLAPGAPVVGHGQVHHIGEARRLHAQGLVQHRDRSQAVQIGWGRQGDVPRLCGQTRGSPKQSTSRGRPSGRPRSRRAACSPTHSACPRTSASASACPPAKQTTSSGVTKRGRQFGLSRTSGLKSGNIFIPDVIGRMRFAAASGQPRQARGFEEFNRCSATAP